MLKYLKRQKTVTYLWGKHKHIESAYLSNIILEETDIPATDKKIITWNNINHFHQATSGMCLGSPYQNGKYKYIPAGNWHTISNKKYPDMQIIVETIYTIIVPTLYELTQTDTVPWTIVCEYILQHKPNNNI